jgi:tyrosyl-tRNA synthetase
MVTKENRLTNDNADNLLKRAVTEVIVEDELIQMLKSGRKLRLKEGFDPSAPDIHLGHMVMLRKMRQFQELGHQVVLIVGDWTAQIGDPSGASVTRPMLTAEEVKVNADTYMKQFFKVVDKSKTEVRWQSEWFGKFDLADVIRLTSRFTVAQFLAREDFSKRYNEGRPIAITELLYPLMQAYDSVAINSDVECGGTDQKFNFLVGRELQGMMGQTPQQCFMTPLLVGTDGVNKMSKSLGNYIGVAEPPEIIFGKTMSIRDDFILNYFELLTDVPDNELSEFKAELDNGANPMDFKKRLARELIIQLYDEKDATVAESHFQKVVQNKELPDDIKEYTITADVTISVLVADAGLAKSRSEASRLINQGAVSIDGEKVTDINQTVDKGKIIKVGKRRYLKTV